MKSSIFFLIAILGMACQNIIGQNSKPTTYPSITIASASGTTNAETGSFSFTVGPFTNILVLSEEDSKLQNDTLQDTTTVSSVRANYRQERIQEPEEAPTAPKNLTDLQLNIYPNPFAERVHLKIEEFEFAQNKKYHFELFDTAGNMLDSEHLTDGEKEIVLTNFPRGIYILVLFGEGEILKSFKLIKSNP